MTPAFSGEIQLAGWSDTHNGGAKVTFWLPDAESLEVFKGLTAKKGNQAGHRFMAALVEIGDDEQPIHPKPSFSDLGPLCREAIDLCRNEKFQEWAGGTEVDAKVFLAIECGIESLKELDVRPSAARLFRGMTQAFQSWLREQK